MKVPNFINFFVYYAVCVQFLNYYLNCFFVCKKNMLFFPFNYFMVTIKNDIILKQERTFFKIELIGRKIISHECFVLLWQKIFVLLEAKNIKTLAIYNIHPQADECKRGGWLVASFALCYMVDTIYDYFSFIFFACHDCR